MKQSPDSSLLPPSWVSMCRMAGCNHLLLIECSDFFSLLSSPPPPHSSPGPLCPPLPTAVGKKRGSLEFRHNCIGGTSLKNLKFLGCNSGNLFEPLNFLYCWNDHLQKHAGESSRSTVVPFMGKTVAGIISLLQEFCIVGGISEGESVEQTFHKLEMSGRDWDIVLIDVFWAWKQSLHSFWPGAQKLVTVAFCLLCCHL